MTTEKLQELMQARMAYFGEHLSDERVTAQLKAYAANLGTVPDDIAEQAFLIALAKCKCLNYFLRDWTTAVRDIQLDALPSPERMWENALDTARSMQEVWETACIAIRTGKELTTAAVRRKFRPCLTDSRKPCATITERLQRRSKHLPRVRVASLQGTVIAVL